MKFSNIHPIAPVSMQPTTQMTRWQLYWATRSDGSVTHHLVGRADAEGRVSSTVVQVDAVHRRVTTRSGRVYSLAGEAGFDSDGQYVWVQWLHFNLAVAGGLVTLDELAGMGH
jgi:hypothetical protein